MAWIQTSLEAITEVSTFLEPPLLSLALPTICIPRHQGTAGMSKLMGGGTMVVTCGIILPQERRRNDWLQGCQSTNWAVNESRWHNTILQFFLESWWISQLVLEKPKMVTLPPKEILIPIWRWFWAETTKTSLPSPSYGMSNSYSKSETHSSFQKGTTIGNLWGAHSGTNVMIYTSIAETDLAPLLSDLISL